MTASSSIEIMVRDCPPERLLAWLADVAGPLGIPIDAGTALVHSTRLGPVLVQPGTDDPEWTAVWFNSIGLPWSSDAACARQASRALGCTVRCDPGLDYPEVHPSSPVFLEVAAGGERLVVWDD